jgi:GTP cyclohydrolase II
MELLPTNSNQTNETLHITGIEALTNILIKRGKLVYLDSSGSVANRNSIALLGPVPLPVTIGKTAKFFKWYVFTRASKDDVTIPPDPITPVSSMLVYGEIEQAKRPPLVRLHSACHTGDILGSMRCDCGPQLHEALKRIIEHGSGALIYLSNHEGRGIGLWGKALAYLLQDQGYDTYEANEMLGYPRDARSYFDSLLVLRHMLGRNKRSIKLLSNNPEKKLELEQQGFKVLEMVRLVAGVNPMNIAYLKAKMENGHQISADDLIR